LETFTRTLHSQWDSDPVAVAGVQKSVTGPFLPGVNSMALKRDWLKQISLSKRLCKKDFEAP